MKKSLLLVVFALIGLTLQAKPSKIICPVDLGENITSCEGETVVLDADTGDPSDIYEWFFNSNLIIGETNPTLDVFISGIYLVEVTTIGGIVCTDEIDVLFNPSPTPTSPTPLGTCDENNDGFVGFMLTDKDTEIIGSLITVTVSYHETLSDAELGLFSLISPYFNIATPNQIIHVRVEDVETGCFAIVELELIVQPTPEINLVDDLILVDEDGNGIEIFDLTIRETQILNGQVATITYHETEADATTNINVIVNPTSYINITNPQTIYYRLENVSFCYSVGNFTLILVDALIDEEPDDIFIDEGDNDGSAIFDLTINEAQMLGSQNPAIALFTYHTSFEDSDNGVNAIATPTAHQNVLNPQTIYVRLTNDNTGFYVLTSFEIETDEILGIEDDFIATLSIFPNPSTGTINIQSNLLTETVGLTIYNLQGQQLFSENKTPNNGTVQMDVSNLVKGIYFVKITSEGTSILKKIIKN